MQEDGVEKAVSEAYVVDAYCFTEAESAITEEMSAYVRGEFKVQNIAKAGYGEIFFSDMDEDDKWYKVKIQEIMVDEKTEKEKLISRFYLVQANSLARSLRYVEEEMGKTMIDYTIVAINETKIMDVFEHHAAEDKKPEEQNDVPEYMGQEGQGAPAE